MDGYTIQCLNLCKAGYGALSEIESWDSDKFLDVLEYEQLCAYIVRYKVEEGRRNGNTD